MGQTYFSSLKDLLDLQVTGVALRGVAAVLYYLPVTVRATTPDARTGHCRAPKRPGKRQSIHLWPRYQSRPGTTAASTANRRAPTRHSRRV